MKTKLKEFFNKINPFDYHVNPIAALKCEVATWIFIIPMIAYSSGTLKMLNQVYEENFYHLDWYVILIISILLWCRISYVISKYLKEKK